MYGRKKRKLNNGSNLTLILVLLAILTLASCIMVGNIANRYAAGDKNVIAVVAEGVAHKHQHKDPNFPFGGNPEMENFDQRWDAETSVDLFKTVYTDADGKVIAESANGDPIIAPGTRNEYEFTLKNTGNISLDFDLNLEGLFQLEGCTLPLYVRLYSEGKWLVGGEEEWLHLSLLNSAPVDHKTIPVGESVTYRFEWQWPFEMTEEEKTLVDNFNQSVEEANRNDTQFGGSGISPSFSLNIKTRAVLTEGAIPAYPDGIEPVTEFVLVALMGVIALFTGIWLFRVLFRRHIYLTGVVSMTLEEKVQLGARRTRLVGDRFAFPRVRLGKHTVKVGKAKCKIRLRSVDSDSGLFLEINKNTFVITVRKNIRAVELYFIVGRDLTVSAVQWAVIDNKHNVYTANGMIPADRKTRCNRTPGGLTVNGKGRYSAE